MYQSISNKLRIRQINHEQKKLKCQQQICKHFIFQNREFLKLHIKVKYHMITLPSSKKHAMVGSKSIFKCKDCGKESTYQNIKDHIEVYHKNGLPCNSWGKPKRKKQHYECKN